MPTAKITGSQIKQNQDGDEKVLLLQVEISDPDDIQSAEMFRGFGVDFKPTKGSLVFVVDAGQANKIAVALNDGTEPAADLGEGDRESYAVSGTSRKATHRQKTDGTHTFNAGIDFAVRYTALEAAFNELKGKWDAFANAYVPGGPTAVGLPPVALASSADISQAKVDEIKIP